MSLVADEMEDWRDVVYNNCLRPSDTHSSISPASAAV